MLDLNATIFYKAKFTISAVDATEDLLWKIVLHIKNWQTAKWNTKDKRILTTQNRDWTSLKNGGRIFSNDEDTSVYIESEYFLAEELFGQYWACSITEKSAPRLGYAPRQWVTEIGFEQDNQTSVTFSCVLSYSDRSGFIGMYEDMPTPSIPKLIRNILSDKTIRCYCGSDDLMSIPKKLDIGDWPQFWSRLIDNMRELPYIYISPLRIDYESENTKLLIDAQELATIICGNALVFYADSLDFCREMQYLCPDNYSCYSGAIRIYFPHIDTSSETDSFRHRYLPAAYIEEHGSEYILKMLRRALAQNVSFYDSFFRVDECRKRKGDFIRRKRMAEIHTQYKVQLNEVENQTMNIAVEEENKRLLAEDLSASLQITINDLKRENFNLSAQVENYRLAAMKSAELERALKERYEVTSLPESAQEVINFFDLIYGDRIAFSDDALKSAKDCTLDASELWKVFHALSTTMRDLFISGNGDPFTKFKNTTGIDCARGEGSMTRKDKSLMRQFETTYQDTMINIEPHITFSRQGQSIHFGFSEIDHKIVVGHCGEHLEIYSSQKRK